MFAGLITLICVLYMIHPLLCLVLVLVPAAFNLTQSLGLIREGGARLDIIITAWDWDSVGGDVKG